MAKIRFGYSDDFTAKNSGVGINTTEPQQNLDVKGIVKGQDLRVTGVSSLTAYEGFLKADHQIAENTTLSFDQGPSASLSGEIIVKTGQTVTVNEIVKETAGVGNNGNTLWHNLIDSGHSGVIDGAHWSGNFFDFDGSNDVISGQICDNLFTDDTDHTIEVWVKFDDVTTRQTIISGYIGGTNDRWDLEVSSGKIIGGHHDAGYFTSTASVVTGVWYHLVFVHDHASSLWRVFINTSTDVTKTNSGRDLTSNTPLGIGDRVDSSIGHLNGQISVVRIYSKKLSSTEISTNYNLGPFAKETSVTGNLITHYNASNPSSYPGTVRDVDTTDFTRAGGSEIECLKIYNTFTPPSGGMNQRPAAPKPGELYYNYDLKTIEFHDGYGWRQVDNTTRSGRGFFMAGYNPIHLKNIDTVNIQSFGNAVNFGDLLSVGYLGACNSNSTRGIYGGGYPAPTPTSQYEYFTLASSGNSIYFGDLLLNGTYGKGAVSSSTRGLRGGYYNAANAIEYITMTTLGDGLDFGDLSEGRAYPVGMSNGTRGVYAGGFFGDGRQVSRSTIDYVIIASKGNAVRFGDLTRHMIPNDSAVSNSTRGIVGSGPQFTGPSATNYQQRTSDYITLASEGNAITFGELLSLGGAGANTETRGLFGGGYLTPSAKTNIIQYVTMSSTGNALDFGDLAKISAYNAGCSDSHGGLGGF